jgi:hypothetical protein
MLTQYNVPMTPRITTSKFRFLFLLFGIVFLIAAAVCLAVALRFPPAWLFTVAFGISGLFYIGLAEICDHISIIANNSRVAAEQLVEIQRILRSMSEKSLK